MQDADMLVLGGNYVQGMFYTPSRGHRGLYDVKLDDEGFALAVELKRVIDSLHTQNEADAALYDVQCALFTILSAANMLQTDCVSDARCIAEAMSFLNYSIPNFSNGSGHDWTAESALREVFSKISTYALRFILDSMSTTLKDIQDDEVGSIDLLFLVGDIANLLSVEYLIPLSLRNKLEDLKDACFNLEVENEE